MNLDPTSIITGEHCIVLKALANILSAMVRDTLWPPDTERASYISP
jgi:hypothetical protein